MHLHNDSDWPDVDFIRMPLILQYLRSNIIRRSTDGLFLLTLILQPGGQPKISQLDLHILIQEQIPQF